ncbi:glycoside hydrolase [Podospora fimiseda]|uniref:alpha-1,2-Mannosidase n=1 Tax=Podospora fimiseda TaxID=252190 RepID=A0AAN7BGQ3_9PEZI|nr:glycoside hydrolase [Podospora fimiseda]
MVFLSRRKNWVLVFTALIFFLVYSYRRLDRDGARIPAINAGEQGHFPGKNPDTAGSQRGTRWSRLHTRNPVKDMRKLPTGTPLDLPKVQKSFGPESSTERELHVRRQMAVRDAMKRCWSSYRKHAWMADELTPVSGGKRDVFGGWGATLVDSMDTLWIMGFKEEFYEAVDAAVTIDFDKIPNDKVNVFETTIRYLGGFLGAYDLSGDKRLLEKAREVGEFLYVAFDTPNRMPVTRWDANAAAQGDAQVADGHTLLAEIGTFALEFTRLSILTGDPKWFDASQRIIDALQEQQNTTALPGMWPVIVNARTMNFTEHPDYTIGAMADSLYEYLPKTWALVGGLLPAYRQMYETATNVIIQNNLFRPMLPDEKDVLISGLMNVRKRDDGTVNKELRPEGQHLVCFAGGMLALGGKLVQNETHVENGRKVTEGCIWTYEHMPNGIMPETFRMHPCASVSHCPWDETVWWKGVLDREGLHPEKDYSEVDAVIASKRIPKGFTSVDDTRYVLRPEAIESVFILYRITGRKDLLETAWKMWEAIERNTKTELANSALENILITDEKPKKSDSMESFWLGETLKYFYLIFSEPGVISLDEYVFNTEAHPLKRLLP